MALELMSCNFEAFESLFVNVEIIHGRISAVVGEIFHGTSGHRNNQPSC